MKTKLSGHELVQLKNKVVENFEASNWLELGALTNKLNEVKNHPRLLRSLNWGDSDYEGLVLTFLRDLSGSNDENLDIVKEYIAKTCASCATDISSEPEIGSKIVFSSNIFQVPSDPPDPNLISVMMPLSKDFSLTYETIKEAAAELGFTCKRADDIWEHPTIIQDVFSLLFRSFIVICDFSGKNPNVFYEAGIAHTLGKHVVPITQSDQDIPFDLAHHRCLVYLNNSEGLSALKQELGSRLSILDEKRI